MQSIFFKLEKFLFYLLVFLIPLQTRKLLYVWWDVEFSEYLSAFLYVTDVIVIAILFLWFIRGLSTLAKISETSKTRTVLVFRTIRTRTVLVFLLAGFFFVSLISLLGTEIKTLGFYQLIKLGEFLLLFFYIRSNFRNYDFGKVAGIFVASGVMQSIWACAQFFTQSDFGLKLLGESPLRPEIPYVANFFVEEDKIIRAYGGFPHPNVLAGFLVAALFFLYFLFLRRRGTLKIWSGTRRLVSDTVLGASLFILALGLVLTFSRAAIGIYILSSFVFFLFLLFHRELRKIYLYEVLNLFILLSVVSCLLSIIFFPYLYSRFSFNPQEEAVTNRVEYSREASSQISKNLLFGVGIGNFIPIFKESLANQPEGFYQPVHNVYLLIASEIGAVGFSIFILFLAYIFYSGLKVFRSSSASEKKLFITGYALLVFGFLLFAFFDHFFWTLQQGRLMFWIVLGIFSGLIVKNTHTEKESQEKP